MNERDSSTSALVGRSADVRRLDTFRASSSFLCTLHGPGGVGKSTLAVAWLARQSEPFVVCTLGACRDANEVLGALTMSILGATAGATPAADLAHIAAARGTRWILFDECEQLDAASLRPIAELIAAAKVRALATSRVPLRIDGESVIEVAPLRASTTAGELSDRDELFVRCVRKFRPDFKVPAEELPALARVSAALEGLPLAIELAAPWLKVTNLDGLADRLEQGIAAALSASSQVTGQRSLRAALGTSLARLTPAAREGLAALTVFVQSFDSDAAIEVIGGPDALGILLLLRDESFVQQDSERPERLSLFAAVREIATEDAEPDVLDAARRRYVAYFERVARDRERAQAANEPMSLRRAFDLRDDLASAAGHILAEGGDDASSRAVRLLWSVFEVLQGTGISSRVREVLAQLGAQATATTSARDRARVDLLLLASSTVIEWPDVDFEAMHDRFSDEPARRRAEIAWRCANMANRLRRHGVVTSLMARAIAAIGPVDPMEAAALRAHAAAYPNENGERSANALTLARQAVSDLERLSAPPTVLAKALIALAAIVIDQAPGPGANALLERCREVSARAGDRRLIENAWYFCVAHAYDTGNVAEIATLAAERSVSEHIVSFYDGLVFVFEAMRALSLRDFEGAVASLERLGAGDFQGVLSIGGLLKTRVALLRGVDTALASVPGELDLDERGIVRCEEALSGALKERLSLRTPTEATRTRVTAALAVVESAAPTSLLGRVYLRSVDPFLSELGVARAQARPTWLVEADGVRFVAPSGELLSLARQPMLQRVLHALLTEHAKGAGGALDSRELANRAWIGERLNDTTALQRVKVAVGRLRKAGFESLLEHTREGYRVRPDAVVLRRS